MIFISKLHEYFKEEFNLSEIDSIKLKYSLEIIISDLSKFAFLFTIFTILGEGTNFFYSALALLTIRLFTGGLHFKTYFGCMVFSIFFFYVSIFLKNRILLNFKITIALLMFSLLTITIFAPVIGSSRPRYSYGKKLQFKLISIILIFIHFSIYFFADKNPYLINSVWVIALQSIQILIVLAPLAASNTASFLLWGEPECPDSIKNLLSIK